jgi:hypothetical protein
MITRNGAEVVTAYRLSSRIFHFAAGDAPSLRTVGVTLTLVDYLVQNPPMQKTFSDLLVSGNFSLPRRSFVFYPFS